MRMFQSKKSKITAAAVAGVLAVSAAGIGAVTTLSTVIAGNHLEATKVDPDNPVTGGALLKLTGDPIDYTFDGTKVHDSVVGDWVLENQGDEAAEYTSAFTAADASSADLEKLVTLEYGTTDGTTITWHDGGTVAEPKTYEESVGLSPASIEGGETTKIPVRLTLDDPTLLPGNAGDANLTIDADFTVSYIAPDNTTSPDGSGK